MSKYFSKIDDYFKSAMKKWIIYHPYFIQSPIANDSIKVNIDDRNGGTKT